MKQVKFCYTEEVKRRILLPIIFISIGILFYHLYGWTSYTNQKDGFTIDYPLRYSHETSRWPETDPSYRVEEYWHEPVDARVPGFSKEVITLHISSSNFTTSNPSSNHQTKQIKVSGTDTIEYIYPDYIEVGPIENNKKFYTFTYQKPTYPNQGYQFPQHLDYFNRMLGSFKFNGR